MRMILAVVGGYALASAIVELLSVGAVLALRWPRSEAALLAAMLGFLIYLVVMLWAVSQRRVGRAAVWIFSGLLVMHGTLYFLAPHVSAGS
jgi:hypothetical protein